MTEEDEDMRELEVKEFVDTLYQEDGEYMRRIISDHCMNDEQRGKFIERHIYNTCLSYKINLLDKQAEECKK